MSFSFNFTGEDIAETSPTSSTFPPPSPKFPVPFRRAPTNPEIEISEPARDEGTAPPPGVGVKREDWVGLLSTLPDRISYSTTLVTSPQKERTALIPRRALFDVRMQIMAESDSLSTSSTTPATPTYLSLKTDPKSTLHTGGKRKKKRRDLNGNIILERGDSEGLEIGLGDVDIEQNVYEGGFKSWEGAMDLARLLLERGPRKDLDELSRVEGVIELGCGTALPALILFQHALASDLSLYFTLCDYNTSVLRLVTLPNILLVWALQHSPSSFSSSPPTLSSTSSTTVLNSEGDLEVTSELIEAFQESLGARGIILTIISGPWSPTLLPALLPLHPHMSLLVLAAETIYSPASLSSFASTLMAILQLVRTGKAFVAAKRVYFGVGGSVDEFKSTVGRLGGVVSEVGNSGIEGCERGFMGGGSGVGRCLMEVQMF